MYSGLIEASPDQVELLENYICVLLAADKKDEAAEQYALLKEKFPESKRLEELSKHFVVEEEPAVPENETAVPEPVEGQQN